MKRLTSKDGDDLRGGAGNFGVCDGFTGVGGYGGHGRGGGGGRLRVTGVGRVGGNGTGNRRRPF